jgi:hypothetical protein
MVFLASHVVSSGMSPLQYFLLQILNNSLIENAQAVKLKAQSLEPLLERCKDADFVRNLLSQEKQMDSAAFKETLVQIVGPGSNAQQIGLLLDLVRTHSPLSIPACQQLSVVFSVTGQATQLQIAKLLMNQVEIGLPVLHTQTPLISGSFEDCFFNARVY